MKASVLLIEGFLRDHPKTTLQEIEQSFHFHRATILRAVRELQGKGKIKFQQVGSATFLEYSNQPIIQMKVWQ